jgi:phage-related protein
MKIKKVEFTTSEMNTAPSGTMKVAYIDVSDEAQTLTKTRTEIVRKYPLSMSLVNTTGVAVELAVIGNEKEELEFYENPDSFYLLIPSNASIGASVKIGRTYKIAVRKLSTNTSSSLRIDFFNHVGVLGIESETDI